MKGFPTLETNSMLLVDASVGHCGHGVEPWRSDLEKPGLPFKAEPPLQV